MLVIQFQNSNLLTFPWNAFRGSSSKLSCMYALSTAAWISLVHAIQLSSGDGLLQPALFPHCVSPFPPRFPVACGLWSLWAACGLRMGIQMQIIPHDPHP